MSNSLLEKEFIKYLNDPNITLISFDIFDTLLFRKCGTPQAVFEKMGEHSDILDFFDTASTFVQYRLEAEKKARKELENNEEITLSDIYDQLPLSKIQKKQFQKIELQYEKEQLIINPQIKRWINLAKKKGKTVLFISDMYLSLKQIEEIASDSFTCKNNISYSFISSEYGLRKATGNLYTYIKDTLNLSFNRWAHIGDNERSDVWIPKNFGIKTLYYGLSNHTKESLSNEMVYMNEDNSTSLHVRELSALLNPYKDKQSQFFFMLGSLFFAPALWEFSHFLSRISQKRNISQLNFLTREGHTFNHCFKQLFSTIPTTLVYASRQSTFLSSLKEIHNENINLSRAFSIQNLYDAYKIQITHPIIQEHSQTLYKESHEFFIDSTTLQAIILKDLREREKEIQSNITQQRVYLHQYLKELLVDSNGALIDFGGGGTTLLRLNNILSKDIQPKINILFYTHKEGYKKLLPIKTLSFLPYTKKSRTALDSIARSCEIFEILLNGNHPTVTGYEKINATIAPSTQIPPNNQNSIDSISDAFLKGIDTFFQIAHVMKLPEKTFNRENLALILARIIDLPTYEETLYLGTLEYDEGRSQSHHYKLIDDRHLTSVQQSDLTNIYTKFLMNPTNSKHKLPWVQGTITRIDPNYLLSLRKRNISPNQAAIDTLIKQLLNIRNKELFVYGAGELFSQLLPHLKEKGILIKALIDSRAETTSFQVEGFIVLPLSKALEKHKSCTILIASSVFSHEIEKTILNYTSSKDIQSHIIKVL